MACFALMPSLAWGVVASDEAKPESPHPPDNAVRHQPWMVLHELAHSYHDRVLGFDHPKVKEAYEAAKKGGKYEKVLIWNGRVGRHYAMTDHKEYFAENTEAFFGTNDIYPFVKAELKEHDPGMYALLAELWGVKEKPDEGK